MTAAIPSAAASPAATRTGTVPKLYDKTYVLRVSGKGDSKGSDNQLQVLHHYDSDPDVARFLSLFDVRMMKASNPDGVRLRREWQLIQGLVVLSRHGRSDFLGIKVAFGRSVFLVYASTAAQMDEESGNAFTRHVREVIADPAFNGEGDPHFTARRDAGEFQTGSHPSVVYAFDPTRFVRTMESAGTLYATAKEWHVAFEAKDIHIDPQLGSHQQLMWMHLAYGAQMEADIGKLRRFVGLLNKARDGLWPYRAGSTPLGATVAATESKQRVLAVDQAQIAAVQALVTLGLQPRVSDRKILEHLSRDHGIVSRFAATAGMPVDNLHPSAAHRFYVQRRLEGYRDGAYSLKFVGVAPGQFRVGSGHTLTRRWEGLDATGQPDRYGSITYRIPFPKPTVHGPDGRPRSGWLDGLTDDEEYRTWCRLIALRGRDDDGRRLAGPLPPEVWNALSDEERVLIADARSSTPQKSRGGRQGRRALTALVRPYRPDGTETGPRMYVRAQGRGAKGRAYCQLRIETGGSTSPHGGISRRPDDSEALASFAESDLMDAAARVLTAAVRQATAEGATLTRHALVSHAVEPESEDAARAAALAAAQERYVRALTAAEGYDLLIAELMGGPEPRNEERLRSARHRGQAAWSEHATARALVETLAAQVAHPPAATPEQLDLTDPRDIVVGLRGVYATGAVPDLFLQALEVTFPTGLRFERGADLLEWSLVGDVALPTADGRTVTIEKLAAPVSNLAGRAAGGDASTRLDAVLRRRMYDGQPLPEAARAGAYTDLTSLRRGLTARLRASGAFPDNALIPTALECPIIETTRALWNHAFGATTARSPFERHVIDVYTGALRIGDRVTTSSPAWAYDPNVDHRLEQLTVVARAADVGAGVLASALGSAIGGTTAARAVLDASAPKSKVNGIYPPALHRVASEGFPDGWYGYRSAALPDDAKRVSAVPCPWTDCAETHATLLVPALEVLVLGAMVLCRRCRRAATPAEHPLREAARELRFPQAYVEWADAQVTRTGAVVRCAANCLRDVGFGVGRTWRWDDDAEERAWHDDRCRAGDLLSTGTLCGYVDCIVDEGVGPGRIRQEGRGRRRWHSRECELAQARRNRERPASFATCIDPACTRDEGAGPGGIRMVRGRRRTVHDVACRRASHPTRSGLIRRWAAVNGIEVSPVGRIPKAVSDAYDAHVEDMQRR